MRSIICKDHQININKQNPQKQNCFWFKYFKSRAHVAFVRRLYITIDNVIGGIPTR